MHRAHPGLMGMGKGALPLQLPLQALDWGTLSRMLTGTVAERKGGTAPIGSLNVCLKVMHAACSNFTG